MTFLSITFLSRRIISLGCPVGKVKDLLDFASCWSHSPHSKGGGGRSQQRVGYVTGSVGDDETDVCVSNDLEKCRNAAPSPAGQFAIRDGVWVRTDDSTCRVFTCRNVSIILPRWVYPPSLPPPSPRSDARLLRRVLWSSCRYPRWTPASIPGISLGLMCHAWFCFASANSIILSPSATNTH